MSTREREAGAASRHLVGRGTIYMVGSVVQLVAATAVLPLLTRQLNATEYGQVAVAMVVWQLLVAFAALGLPDLIVRDYFIDPSGGIDDARRMVTTAAVVASAIAVAVFASGPLWAPIFGAGSFTPALRFAVVAAVPAIVVVGSQGALRAADRAALFVVVSGLVAVLGQGLGLLFSALRPSAGSFMAGLTVGQLVGAVVCAVGLRLGISGLITWSRMARALRISLPTVVHMGGVLLLVAGDRVVVERVLDSEAVGRYQIAYAVGSLGLVFLTAINNAWAPIVHRGAAADSWEELTETTRTISTLTLGFLAGLMLMSPIAVAVLAPPSYRPGDLVPLVCVIALAAVPYVWYLSASHVVFARAQTRVLAWLTPLVAATNLLLCVVLVPHFGLMGAGVATTVCYLLWGVSLRLLVAKMTTIRWVLRSEWLVALSALAIAAVCAVAPTSAVWLVARVAAAGIVFFLVMRFVVRIVRERPLEAGT